MYRLSNISFNDWQITPGQTAGSNLAVAGMLDMPKRVGKTSHSWGNEIEPYVAPSEIRYSGRDIRFTGLIEATNRTETAARLTDFYSLLKNLSKLVVFETPYGNFNVALQKAVKVDWLKYKGYCTIDFILREPVVLVPTPTIPVGTKPNEYGIDSIAFSDFGMYIKKVTGNFNHPEIENMAFKAYETEGYQFTNPKVQKVNIDLIAVGADFASLKTNIQLLHAILAQAGLRNLNIDGRTLQAYNINGFTVTSLKVSTNIAVATIKLVMDLYAPVVIRNLNYLKANNGAEITDNNFKNIQV